MFEKFFGPKTPENKKETLEKIANSILGRGVNKPNIYLAFQALREKVAGDKLSSEFSDDVLLDIVENQAFVNVSAIEDSMYGGANTTNQLISQEIQSLREEIKQ